MSTRSIHDRWMSRFTELQGFLEAHGRVPRLTKDASEDERRLSSWVGDQRARHKSGTLPAAYLKDLRTIEGVFSTALSQRQESLKAWVATHGRRPLPGSTDPEEAAFAVLFFSLRSYALRGRLGAAAVELILTVPDGFTSDEAETVRSLLADKVDARRRRLAAAAADITPLEAKWNLGFAELQGWVQAHGSLPNRRSTDSTEYRCSNWLNVQRMQHRKDNLLPEYVRRLQTIPGAFETRAKTADPDAAARVAAFHAEHGRLPVLRGADSSERALNMRLRRLRSKIGDGTLAADVVEILSSIPGATAPIATHRQHRPADLD
ncbi:MAG TPA: helicase associated domain-containing protein [Arthrobacter sp.]